MNLEEIEQKTLAYLKQVSNPLVRIDVLFDHLRREIDLGSLSRDELVAFLRQHELFRVLDPVVADDESGQMLREAGLLAEQSVILDTRMPTRTELAATMLDQMDRLGEALIAALREAKQHSDAHAEAQVQAALEKASRLREQITRFVAAESREHPEHRI